MLFENLVIGQKVYFTMNTDVQDNMPKFALRSVVLQLKYEPTPVVLIELKESVMPAYPPGTVVWCTPAHLDPMPDTDSTQVNAPGKEQNLSYL